jgi:hypothetical protein
LLVLSSSDRLSLRANNPHLSLPFAHAGYLIYGRILRCKYIPASQLKWHVFKNAKTPYPEFNHQELEQQRRSTVRRSSHR